MLRVSFAGVCALAAVLASAQTGDFAIVGVKVEVGDGTWFENTVVVVKGGKIESVVSGGQAPPGMTTMDGKGKVLYPGFIDAFSTRGFKTGEVPKDEDKPNVVVTAPPTMWLGNRKGVYPEFLPSANLEIKADDSRLRQGITTAALGSSRGGLRGWISVVDLLPSGESRILQPMFAQSASFRLGANPTPATGGPGPGGPGGGGYPGNILGGVALTRQTLADALSYKEGAFPTPADGKPKAIMKALEALVPVVTREKPLVFEANTEREGRRVIDLAAESGFDPIIYGAREAALFMDVLSPKTPVVLTAEPMIEPLLKGTDPNDDTPDEVRKERHDKWERVMTGPTELAKAGVPFAFSSEGGDFLKGVQARIKLGLDRNKALEALTLGAAKILKLDDQIGSVKAGKRANFVLMSGDFADPKSEVLHVWVEGQSVYPAKKEEGK